MILRGSALIHVGLLSWEGGGEEVEREERLGGEREDAGGGSGPWGAWY